MDDFQTKMETTTSKLNELKLVAQEKENELFSEREKTKKANEEASMLMGTVESLTSQMTEMEKRLEEVEEKAKQIEARAEIEAKRREYQKFLVGTLTKEVAKRRYGYLI